MHLHPKNPRSSGRKTRKSEKAFKTQIWGQNSRFGATGQIILKVYQKGTDSPYILFKNKM